MMRGRVFLAVALFAWAALEIHPPTSEAQPTVPRWDVLPAPELYEHTAVHDPVRDRMIVFGGRHGEGYPVIDLWEMSLEPPVVWSRIKASGAGPSRRHDHAAIYDPIGDRMLVFGGVDAATGQTLNDVWALNLEGSATWVQVAAYGEPPSPRAGHSMTYDPVRDRALVFGGSPVEGGRGLHLRTGLSNEVWALSLSPDETWSQLETAAAVPDARYDHSAIYDPVRDRLVICGGRTESERAVIDIWALALSSDMTWSTIEVQEGWPLRGHSALYDPTADQMLLFAGENEYCVATNYGLALRLTDPVTWTYVTPPAQPRFRFNHAAIYDPMRRAMFIHGGFESCERQAYFSDSWRLSLTDEAWVPLTPPGTEYHSAVYDPTRDQMVVVAEQVWTLDLGGRRAWTGSVATPYEVMRRPTVHDPVRDRVLAIAAGSVWALDRSKGDQWLNLAVDGVGPTAARTAVYDPIRDRVIAFGGGTWILSLSGDPEWEQVFPAGSPPVGEHFSAVIDPLRDQVVVISGPQSWKLALVGALEWVQLGHDSGLTWYLPQTAIHDPVRDRVVAYDGGAVWSLDLASSTWSFETTSGATAQNGGHSAIYDRVRDRMIVFGGVGINDDHEPHSETFALTWGAIAQVEREVGARLRLGPAFPNPARSRVAFLLDLPSDAQVAFSAHDLAGRLVHKDDRGMLPAGRHALTWETRSSKGGGLPAGIYFVRVRVGAEILRRVVTLMP